MKKLLPFLSLAVFAVACNSKTAETEVKPLQSTQSPVADTTGLAQFQQWKAQNELNAAVEPQQVQPQVVQAPPVRTVEVIREVRVVEKAAPVRRKATHPKNHPVASAHKEETNTGADNTAKGEEPTAGNSGTGETAGTGTTQETAKKEGWSKATKGAVIGGAGGAVIGAVISKNKAAGAVIGGVLGGAVGYGIGKSKDKKDGRN